MEIITPKDINQSFEAFGLDMLSCDFTKFKDNRTIKKSDKVFDTTWLKNITVRRPGGKEVPLMNLKFKSVVTASAAKPPPVDGAIKNLTIGFTKLTLEEIMQGDLAPKVMSNEEEQKIENERALKKAQLLKESTDEYCDALNALWLSYEKLCEDLKNTEGLEFTLNKDPARIKEIKANGKKAKKSKSQIEKEINQVVTVNTGRQTTFVDKETKEDTPLKNPFIRIKLMLDKNGTVSIGEWNDAVKAYEEKPNVYDARKMNKKNGFKPILAKVKSKTTGRWDILDKKNACEFITIRSVIGGYLSFPQISIHSKGISWDNKFRELYVKSNRSIGNVKEVFTPEDFKEMNDGSDTEEDDYQDDRPVSQDNEKDLNNGDEIEVSDIEDIQEETNDADIVEEVREEEGEVEMFSDED